MVASSINKKTTNPKININNKNIRALKINEPRLYKIVELKKDNPKILSIETESKIKIYSFAFR